MGKLVINQKLVNEQVAQELEKLCPFKAIEYDGKELSINASCKNCKLCVKRGKECAKHAPRATKSIEAHR